MQTYLEDGSAVGKDEGLELAAIVGLLVGEAEGLSEC